MRSAQFKSIIDVFPYGAPELKEVMRRYLAEACVIAVAGHIVLAIAFLHITNTMKPVEQPAERIVRITKYSDIEPPPSIALSTAAGVVAPASPPINNPAEAGILEVIRQAGIGNNGNDMVSAMLGDDLAAGIEQVTSSNRALTTGRGKSNGTAKPDANAMFATSGNGSGIDDLLQTDLGAVESVKLTKSGKVNVEGLGKVSASEEVIGARSDESLRQVLAQNMGRLQYIYNKFLKNDPEMGGKLEVEVAINADGTVRNAMILNSDFANPDFEREILSAMRRWKYGAITSGEMKVVYPVLFVRAN